MTNGGDEPAAEPVWAAVAADYAKNYAIAKICAKHGLTRQAFDERRKQEGWQRNKARSSSTTETIRRLKDLLHRRLADLEGQLASIGAEVSAAASEREIKSMNTLVRTLEKVLELERKDRASRRARRGGLRIVDNARRLELAARIAALAGTWRDPDSPQGTDTG
jgi:chromosome segregation ATPase